MPWRGYPEGVGYIALLERTAPATPGRMAAPGGHLIREVPLLLRKGALERVFGEGWLHRVTGASRSRHARDPPDHEEQRRPHSRIHPASAGQRPSIPKAWGDVGLKARLNPRYPGTPPHPER